MMTKMVILPVDAGDVDDHVDHVAAQFVRGHVHGAAVCGDVNLAHHVEQEGLLNTRILREHTESEKRSAGCQIWM